MLIALTGHHLPKDTTWEDDNRLTKQGKKLSPTCMLQYVAPYPDGTSIRTLETKTQFLRHPFQLSVNEVFRMKDEHFSFKIKVLAI